MNTAAKISDLLDSQFGILRFDGDGKYKALVTNGFITKLATLVTQTSYGTEAMVEVEGQCLNAELNDQFQEACGLAEEYLVLIERLRASIRYDEQPESVIRILLQRSDEQHEHQWRKRLLRLERLANRCV